MNTKALGMSTCSWPRPAPQKTASGKCRSALLASPGTIGSKVSSQFGLPNDPPLQGNDWK